MADAGKTVDNGVNVEALIGAREALTEAPEAAQFTWRASCEWKNGTHSHSTVESFFGLGEEQHRKKTFEFDADQDGVFTYYCSEFCSALHLEMMGYFFVKP